MEMRKMNMIENRELLILDRAIEYTNRLANGIDPLTGARVSPNDIVTEQRIQAYLKYVEQILRKYRYDQLNPKTAVKNTIPFSITPEQLRRYEYTAEPVSATVFCRRLTALTDTEGMKAMSSQDVGAWMMKEGYLEETLYQGRMMKTATEKGRQTGVFAEETYHPERGSYIRITYNATAQKLLLNHLNEVIGCSARQREEAKKQNAPEMKVL